MPSRYAMPLDINGLRVGKMFMKHALNRRGYSTNLRENDHKFSTTEQRLGQLCRSRERQIAYWNEVSSNPLDLIFRVIALIGPIPIIMIASTDVVGYNARDISIACMQQLTGPPQTNACRKANPRHQQNHVYPLCNEHSIRS